MWVRVGMQGPAPPGAPMCPCSVCSLPASLYLHATLLLTPLSLQLPLLQSLTFQGICGGLGGGQGRAGKTARAWSLLGPVHARMRHSRTGIPQSLRISHWPSQMPRLLIPQIINQAEALYDQGQYQHNTGNNGELRVKASIVQEAGFHV